MLEAMCSFASTFIVGGVIGLLRRVGLGCYAKVTFAGDGSYVRVTLPNGVELTDTLEDFPSKTLKTQLRLLEG